MPLSWAGSLVRLLLRAWVPIVGRPLHTGRQIWLSVQISCFVRLSDPVIVSARAA